MKRQISFTFLLLLFFIQPVSAENLISVDGLTGWSVADEAQKELAGGERQLFTLLKHPNPKISDVQCTFFVRKYVALWDFFDLKGTEKGYKYITKASGGIERELDRRGSSFSKDRYSVQGSVGHIVRHVDKELYDNGAVALHFFTIDRKYNLIRAFCSAAPVSKEEQIYDAYYEVLDQIILRYPLTDK